MFTALYDLIGYTGSSDVESIIVSISGVAILILLSSVIDLLFSLIDKQKRRRD